MIRITCLGGTGTVTGSCFLVESTSGQKVLVDCGMFQGGRRMEERNRAPWGFNPSEITNLFLTHAHIDHSGRIPKLVKDGFEGKIITSPPTVELCKIMLLDSAHIQEMDADWQTRKNLRKGDSPVEPLYTTEDAERCMKFFHPVERDEIIDMQDGLKVRLRNAGHILGSSIVELWLKDASSRVKVVFSGDIGKRHQLIVKDPHEIFDADYLFVESTYGDRFHRPFDDSKKELLEAIKYSVRNNEKTIIPAFAVERTQEILYILGEFFRKGLIPDIPVYLDSPLAIKATRIFRKNKKCYDEETMAIVDAGFDPFDMPNLRLTEKTDESMEINRRDGPAIVIAGNGMCTAGRIKHHLKHNLWREGASIVIVGFQAKGTTGRKLVEGEKTVKIFREKVAVKAKIFTIGGLSAHADQGDLLEWVGHFESNPKVFVVHGEENSSKALAEKIRERFGLQVKIPRWKERLILKSKEMKVLPPSQKEEHEDLRVALNSVITELEANLRNLKEKMNKIPHTELSNEQIDRLRYINEEFMELL